MKKSTKGQYFDDDELFFSHYGTTHNRFEYLRRLAFNAGHNSVNKILDELYPRKWKKELEHLRDTHRKLGYNDAEFYHSAVKKRMGVAFKPGRHKKIFD